MIDPLQEHVQIIGSLRDIEPQIFWAGDRLIQTVLAGGKILFCGNGGSSAMAQHFAAELVVRFAKNRHPLPGLALADSTILTAISNDFAFEDVFARQVRALGRLDDAVVILSTSGESENAIRAARAADEARIHVIALTGAAPNALERFAGFPVCVPSRSTARIQEAHLLIGHIWCQRIEEACG